MTPSVKITAYFFLLAALFALILQTVALASSPVLISANQSISAALEQNKMNVAPDEEPQGPYVIPKGGAPAVQNNGQPQKTTGQSKMREIPSLQNNQPLQLPGYTPPQILPSPVSPNQIPVKP